MELTTQVLQKYKGGQMEIKNSEEGYLLRGEVKTIEIVDDEFLRITFAWLAKDAGFPSMPPRWVRADPIEYVASHETTLIDDLDYVSGEPTGGNILHISSMPTIGREIATLYTPAGDKIDPAFVEGLQRT